MMMNAYGNAGDYDKCVELGAMDCIECGSCAYVCPARIQLVQRFRLTKLHVQQARAAAKAKPTRKRQRPRRKPKAEAGKK